MVFNSVHSSSHNSYGLDSMATLNWTNRHTLLKVIFLFVTHFHCFQFGCWEDEGGQRKWWDNIYKKEKPFNNKNNGDTINNNKSPPPTFSHPIITTTIIMIKFFFCFVFSKRMKFSYGFSFLVSWLKVNSVFEDKREQIHILLCFVLLLVFLRNTTS